ncbi:MAG: heparinase II/III domain-containing protein, partial [Bradyrhizobium sp.]
LVTTAHDGYLARFGIVHRRVILMAPDGSRLDGEDTVSPAPGARIRGSQTDYALRFHLHPAVKANRLADARTVMLVLPNRDVWTFEALDDGVELEDSVFLAGSDGPRRTAQIVIRQDARHAGSIRWSFVRSSASPASPAASAARRNAQRQPELPL